MKLLIIDKPAKLDIKYSTIRVDLQKIPLHLLETIMLIGTHQLDSNFITKVNSNDITILLFDKSFKNSSIITPTKGKNSELKLSQYRAVTDKKRALNIAKYIIQSKISYHIKHLKEHNIEVSFNYQHIDQADKLETLLGIEGSFANIYFKHYFSLLPKVLHKSKRTKRPPLDPVNALLSLYYTLFYNITTIKLLSFGFEPSIGFLHKPFRSHNALSSDIVEFIRADINEFVYTLFKNKTVTTEDFTKKNGVFLKYQSRKRLWVKFQLFQNQISPKIDSFIANIRSLL